MQHIAAPAAPCTVDLNIVGSCNLRCPFCWGPPHEQGALLGAEQWLDLVWRLKARGTRSIVLTGGEPLLRRDLPQLCQEIHERNLRLTLSTNGMLLPALAPRVLPYIDELGLPIDGASDADNQAMRVSPGGRGHLPAVREAIDAVIAFGRPLELTIRTVVSRRNAHAIAAIGRLVERIDWPDLRWKLYRFVPIGYGAAVRDDFWVEQDFFEAIVEATRRRFAHLRVDALGHAEREGRYLHILPNGDAITPTARHEEIALGNAPADLDGVLAALALRLNPAHNGQHGRPPAAFALGS